MDSGDKSRVNWTKRRRMLDAIALVSLVFILFLSLSNIISQTVFGASFFVLVVVYLSLSILILYRKKKQTSKPST
jgi:hypothetical protein